MRSLFFFCLLIVAAHAQPGTISTFAGAYPDNFGGPAKQAALNIPGQMAQDPAGNIYIAGTSRIYRLTPTGRLDLFAGTGVQGFSGDNGPAVLARLSCSYASGIVWDRQGNLIFSDSNNNRIRQISSDGIIRTMAGTGVAGFGGDGGPALSAQLSQPHGLAIDASGSLYIADLFNNRVRKIDPTGKMNTVVGDGTNGYGGDGGPAIQAAISQSSAVAIDSLGNLYVGDRYNGVVRKVGSDGIITTIAGRNQFGSPQKDAKGNSIDWTVLFSLAFDRADNLYITVNNRVLKRDRSGTVTFAVGSGIAASSEYQGPAIDAPISTPRALLVDSQGNLLMALSDQYIIGIVDNAGIFSVIAGVGLSAGASGPPVFARLIQPSFLAFDRAGALYALEGSGLGTLRKLTSVAVTSLKNVAPFSGGITIDSQGNLYFSDTKSGTIQKIDTSGVQTTFAGTPGSTGGYGGDGGPARQALLQDPWGLAFDSAGALYIADKDNNRIRKVTSDGIIQTIAGSGTAGFGGDGGPAALARLNAPNSVAIDVAGNLYIADGGNARIRKVAGGTISTIAGTGQFSFTGDGGPATSAAIGAPREMAFDSAGNLYFSDSTNRVRKVTPNGIVSTAAGNGNPGLSGDGGPAANASLATPRGLAIDANGNIYIADRDNDRIRKVQGSAPFSVAPLSLLYSVALGGSASAQTLTLSSSDGAVRQFHASSSAPWISVAPSDGAVNSGDPVPLAVTVNPAGLKKGTYSASITLLDPAAGAVTLVPVTLTVSATVQQLRLSQVGLTFSAIQGGAAPAPQAIQVLNAGAGSMPWTAKSATLAGNNWLSLSPSSGTTVVGSPPPALQVSVNPAGLSAGSYYGQIDVSAPSADNSPQSAVVLFNILPTDGTPGPQLNPSGLLFTATPGATPAVQSVEMFNPATRTSNYTAAVRFTSGSGWLTAPAAGALTAGQRRTIDIQPRATSLAAGVYRATISFTFTPDNVSRTVDVAFVVNAAVVAANAAKTNAAGVSCAAKQLVTVLRRPGASYQTAAGWPVSVEAAVVDDCGVALTEGKVITSFSTNDPVLPLLHTGNGIWQGTWASRSANAALTVTVKAQSTDQKLAGQTQVAIRSDLNPNQPSIASGGILNAASFRNDTPVSPGEYVSVFGARLAGQFQQAATLPLPMTLGDTLVAIGGMVAPLHFASDGQVNAILPYGIPDSTRLQMIVQRGNLLSIPEDVLIGTTQPAVFTIDGTGTGQGHIYGATAEGTLLADNAHPVKAGDTIVLLATGLGPVNPPVAAANPAPSDPLSLPVNPIEVTIQGKKARVLFAGLAPGFAGVFQVNAIVPDEVAVDPAAPLIVSAGGQPSPPVTLAITK